MALNRRHCALSKSACVAGGSGIVAASGCTPCADGLTAGTSTVGTVPSVGGEVGRWSERPQACSESKPRAKGAVRRKLRLNPMAPICGTSRAQLPVPQRSERSASTSRAWAERSTGQLSLCSLQSQVPRGCTTDHYRSVQAHRPTDWPQLLLLTNEEQTEVIGTLAHPFGASLPLALLGGSASRSVFEIRDARLGGIAIARCIARRC